MGRVSVVFLGQWWQSISHPCDIMQDPTICKIIQGPVNLTQVFSFRIILWYIYMFTHSKACIYLIFIK